MYSFIHENHGFDQLRDFMFNPNHEEEAKLRMESTNNMLSQLLLSPHFIALDDRLQLECHFMSFDFHLFYGSDRNQDIEYLYRFFEEQCRVQLHKDALKFNE
eukprot:1120333_1